MSDDIDIILENNDSLIAELADSVTFWNTIYGSPSASSSLVSYLNSLLNLKQDLIYYIVATEADKDSISNKKTGLVVYVKATKILYIYNAEVTPAEWVMVTRDLSDFYTKAESDAKFATKQDTLISGTNIKTINNQSILGAGNIEVTAVTAWGSITGTLSNQTDLQTALNTKANQTSLTTEVNDRQEADTDLQDQITEIDETISGYGNIVTHNVNEFATAAQGALADTAIQPNDNISELTNNAGYITKAVNNLDNYMLTSDINIALSGKQPNLTSANAGTGISITGSGSNVVISNTQTSAEWGNITGTLSNQTDLQTALNNKVTKNSDITGATKCKVTYDSKGLVTAGADLEASDIPSLTLSKISDVTATAGEVNVLDGVIITTTELNYLDDVTSNVQTQLNSKQPTLVSGTNIKTVNNNSLLGSGNIDTNTKSYVTLASSGTVSLTADTVYYMNCTGTTTFSLPTVTDDNFHQILIDFTMVSTQTVTWGTSNYFKKTAPDITSAGTYNVIYEYSKALGGWVVGAMSKGAAS